MRKDGQYYFVQRGAVLSNDFFEPSMFRQSWDSLGEYKNFLIQEGLDYVVIEREYLEDFDTNELDLLNELVEKHQAKITYQDPEGRFTVFDVRIDSRKGLEVEA